MRKLYLRLLSALTLIVMVIGSGAAIVSAAPPAAQLAATVSYTADNATVFNNPERGFHNRYEIINDTTVNDYATPTNPSGGFNPDSVDRTFARAKAAGNTIIHSYLHLDKYTTTDTLPAALLNNLSSGLAAIRTAGLKIVLRPAYTWGDMPSVPEARIIGHIAQINAVISANADVVVHLEAGYLGPWGEWHSSLYTDYTKQSEGEIRYRIAKKLLDTTPASLPIVIRYPMALKEILEIPTPAGSSPLTQTDRDRLGSHNDCFLYNAADRGTYDKVTWLGTFSIAQQQQYVFDMSTSYGGNKMMGGETCDGNGRNDAAAVTVQSEMAALNFTEINVDFWDGAINLWKAANLSASGNDPAETAFVRLQRKMGYRLRLVDATFPTSAAAGSNFTFSANLNNGGYSSVIKSRPIFLVLQNAANRFNLQMSGVDVRKWVSGANALAQQTVTLPANMPAGTYKLALWLPDSASGLQSRPEYSIRLANTGTWDAAMGYNVLSTAITISSGGGSTATPMPTYTKTLTPTFTPTHTSTPSGYAAYEAESGSNTLAGGATVSACSTCSGSNKVGNVGNNAGTLQFNSVNGAAAGNYTLTMYYINGDSAARNATISVNAGGGTNISFAPTGSWTAVGSVQTTVSLNAGSSNTIKFSNASGWAPDFDRVTIALNGGGATNTPIPATKTNTPVGPTATKTNTPIGPTPTKTNTPVGPTPTNTVGASATPSGVLLLDNFDGVPAWSTGTTNDLGKWAGANGFANGTGGAGVESGGALTIQYNTTGWFGSDVLQDVSSKTYLVFVIKGAAGGEQNAFHVILGGVDNTFAALSGDTITTAYKTIRINMVTKGINRVSPGQLQITFSSAPGVTITIDEIRFE